MKKALLAMLTACITTSCAPGAIVSSTSIVSLESVYLSEIGQQQLMDRMRKELSYEKDLENN